jgi:hypothetical protein
MEKDIEYYLNNPDEVPDDPAALEALAAQDGMAVKSAGTDEKPDAGVPSDADQGVKENQVQQDQKGEEPAPVLAKDGKHTIPYSVLEGSRKRADQAEQIAEQMAAKIADLEMRLKAAPGDAGTKGDAKSDDPDVSAADMAMIREEFPEFAKVLEAQSAQIKNMESRLEQQHVREEEVKRSSVADMVQDTIDSIPKLAHIQAQNPALFKKAIEMDNALRSDPSAAELTLSERFTRVLSGVEAMYGVIQISGSAAPGRTPQEMAREALGKAKSTTPNSLSDLPSGTPPHHSEIDRVSGMAPVEVGLMMENMTDAQQEAFLNNL